MACPVFRSITLISSPYHSGVPNVRVARGPTFLKQRGLLDRLRSTELPVNEVEVPSVENEFHGDIARSFELFRRTSELVRQAQEKQFFPVVLAGNCGASVGVAAGLTQAIKKVDGELACV